MAKGDVITDRTSFPPHLYPWPTTHRGPIGSPGATSTLVVAVGSNASPDVLRHKLTTVPPMVDVCVGNLAVGHSAHVSAQGYIAATGRLSPGSKVSTRAAWLDPQQRAELDATEPNYSRIRLSTKDFPVVSTCDPAGGEVLAESFDIYESRHGVLSDPSTGAPLPFGDQHAVFDALGLVNGSAAEVCRRLSEPPFRSHVSARMRALAVDSGLRARSIPDTTMAALP